MARPRRLALDSFTRILAAACGVRLEMADDVLPYDPAVMEAMARGD
jgi:hypothetical protein